ncbi:MAG: hypothetical protein ACM30I_10475 [Gemmatimonas sp.]
MVEVFGEPLRDAGDDPEPHRDPSRALWRRWFEAMLEGDTDRAWAISDAVLARRDPATRDDARQPFHVRWVWDGRPFDGRDVLVRCYHGLGDTLQFARFLPRLRARARSVRVEVQPGLIPLLRGLDDIEAIPFRRESPLPPSDCDIECMELAHALRARASSAPPPYLVAPRGSVERMRSVAGAPGRPRVGLCWRGGDWSDGRSLALTELTRSLPDGVAVINLQGDDGADEARASGLPFLNSAPLDVADAAAAIALCDRVVSVDTMIAHLAGALGRPLSLLLPGDCDWRWSRAGDRSPWYPSARLYRQETQGDWRAPLARLASDLAAALGRSPSRA